MNVSTREALIMVDRLGTEAYPPISDEGTSLTDVWDSERIDPMRIFVPIIVIFAAVGCRETEAPPTHFEDLGDAGAPLLPTTPVWKQAAIAGGQAEWHAFRDPTVEEQADEAVEDDAVTEDSAGETGDTGGGETETEIRELIAEFNELMADATADDILEYFVEEQAEALKPIIDAALATTEILTELQSGLDGKLPDAGDRIKNALDKIRADMSLALRIKTIDVKSDTEVDVSVDGGVISQGYRFIIVDDDWYIAVTDAHGLGERGTSLANGLKYYGDMLEDVKSGSDQAEKRLGELEAAVAAANEGEEPDSGSGG